MKKIGKYIGTSFVLAALLLCTGCNKKVEKKEVIGVLLRNDNDLFIATYKDGRIKAAEENGITIQAYSANNDAAIQIDQLKTMLLNGVRHFVIIAYNTDLTEQMAKIINS